MDVINSFVFSVVVPVYNSATYLHQSSASVLRQTFSRCELILVNDGSTDNSLSICKEIELACPYRVKVIDQANSGPFEARKAGIAASQGEYVLFLDSDDALHEDALAILNRELDKDRVDLLFFRGCKNESFEWDELSETARLFPTNEENSLRDARDLLVSADLSNSLALKCVRRKCLDGYVNSDKRNLIMAEDKLASAYILESTQTLRQIDDVLYFYRTNENSTTNNSYTRKRFDDLCEVANELSTIANGWDLKDVDLKNGRRLVPRLCSEIRTLMLSDLSASQRPAEIEHIRQNDQLKGMYARIGNKELKLYDAVLLKMLYNAPSLLNMYSFAFNVHNLLFNK